MRLVPLLLVAAIALLSVRDVSSRVVRTPDLTPARRLEAWQRASAARAPSAHLHAQAGHEAQRRRQVRADEVAGPSVEAFQSSRTEQLRALPPLALQARGQGQQLQHGRAALLPPSSTLTLNPSARLQRLVGFGGAITEASVTVLAKMPPSVTDEVIQAYYGPDGNRYSLGRLHINSCDFSVEGNWNFDDHADDFKLEYFDTELKHEQQYLLPFLHRVLNASYHPLQLFASPWSPPGWMKTNGQMQGSNSPCLKEDPAYHQAWAKYLALWITSMKAQGIPFWGMTVQNEPEYAAPWEACTWTAEEERDFIANWLGPIIKAEHPEVNIVVFDHNKDHVADWADVIFADPDADRYVWGIGVHWYSGDSFDHLNQTHEHWPRKGILATEATNVDGVRLGDVERAEKYGHDIIGDLNNWVQGWTDWNIVLDERGGPNHLGNFCDAPIIADTQKGTLTYQPMYWYLAHFSRFLPPGSVRIAHDFQADGAAAGLELVAFLVPREGAEHEHEQQQQQEAQEGQREEKKQHAEKESKAHRRHLLAHGEPHSSKGGKGQAKATAEPLDVVLVVMNAQNEAAAFELLLNPKHSVTVQIDAHAIQTLRFDATLLK